MKKSVSSNYGRNIIIIALEFTNKAEFLYKLQQSSQNIFASPLYKYEWCVFVFIHEIQFVRYLYVQPAKQQHPY